MHGEGGAKSIHLIIKGESEVALAMPCNGGMRRLNDPTYTCRSFN